MPGIMELRQLRYFVTLASSLNYSRAADQLCITQGTLSQQISQLEAELDTRLFDRTSRRVSLTDAGRMLLPLAQRTLDESALCKRRMLEMKRLQCGTLRIGAAYCFDRFLPDALKLMRSRHPEVTLQVCRRKSSEILGLVRACEIDLALAFVPQAFAAPGVMRVETLFVSRPCAILRRDHPLAAGDRPLAKADHPLAFGDRQLEGEPPGSNGSPAFNGYRGSSAVLSLESLNRQGIILPSAGLAPDMGSATRNGPAPRNSFDGFAGIDTSGLDVRMALDDPDLILDMVAAGHLIAILPPTGLEEKIAARFLTAVSLTDSSGAATPPMPCCAITRDSTPALDAFLGILREVIADS